jgi:hypothetical protein
MNARIKELAKEARVYADAVTSGVSSLPEGKTWQTIYDEKFAELIVRECAAQCDEYAMRILKFSQFGSNAAADCANIIKQHFGVE